MKPKVFLHPDAALAQTTRNRDWWKGVTLRRCVYTSDFSIRRPAADGYRVSYFSAGKSRLIQKRGGKIHEGRVFAGMSLIIPRGCDASYVGEANSVTMLEVPHELVSRAADQINGRARINYEITSVFETRDTTIGNLTNLLLAELNKPVHPAQALMTDSISSALATHLLRSYNVFGIQEHLTRGFGPYFLSEVISYIEDHTDTPISLDDLASIAGVSRFHFSRLFKKSTGKSPIVYVTESRIRKAQQLILSGKFTLSEVALMVGFADQSHLTRQFQRYTGCTPAVYARNNGIKLF